MTEIRNSFLLFQDDEVNLIDSDETKCSDFSIKDGSFFFDPEETNNLMRTHNFVEKPFLPEVTLSRIPEVMLKPAGSFCENICERPENLKELSQCANSGDSSNTISSMREHIMKMSMLGTINLDAIFSSPSKYPYTTTSDKPKQKYYQRDELENQTVPVENTKHPYTDPRGVKSQHGNNKNNNINLLLTSELYNLKSLSEDTFNSPVFGNLKSCSKTATIEPTLTNAMCVDDQHNKQSLNNISEGSIVNNSNGENSVGLGSGNSTAMVPFIVGSVSSSSGNVGTNSLSYKTASSVVHIENTNPGLEYSTCNSFPQVDLEGVRSTQSIITLTESGSGIQTNTINSDKPTDGNNENLIYEYDKNSPFNYEMICGDPNQNDFAEACIIEDDNNGPQYEPASLVEATSGSLYEPQIQGSGSDFLNYEDIAGQGPIDDPYIEKMQNDNGNSYYNFFGNTSNLAEFEQKIYNVTNDFITTGDEHQLLQSLSNVDPYENDDLIPQIFLDEPELLQKPSEFGVINNKSRQSQFYNHNNIGYDMEKYYSDSSPSKSKLQNNTSHNQSSAKNTVDNNGNSSNCKSCNSSNNFNNESNKPIKIKQRAYPSSASANQKERSQVIINRNSRVKVEYVHDDF